MKLNTVIFDMDGLLIDSEPLWQEASQELMRDVYDIRLPDETYQKTMGLRTRECLDYWFRFYDISRSRIDENEQELLQRVIQKVKAKGEAMQGVTDAFELFRKEGYKIGLASSSSLQLIDIVIDQLNIRSYLQAVHSAEHLSHGKPHPQVYLNCAESLGSNPLECVCLEDSFNGMIAVKAARMKCIIIPTPHHHQQTRWGAADLKLKGLYELNSSHLQFLQG